MEVDLTDDDPIPLFDNQDIVKENEANLTGKTKETSAVSVETVEIIDDDEEEDIIFECSLPSVSKPKDTQISTPITAPIQPILNTSDQNVLETSKSESKISEVGVQEQTIFEPLVSSSAVEVSKETDKIIELSEKVKEVNFTSNTLSKSSSIKIPGNVASSNNIIDLTDVEEEKDQGLKTCDLSGDLSDNSSQRKESIDLQNTMPKPVAKRKTENKCLNVRCQSGDHLDRAPVFILVYYGRNVEANKRELVCSNCFDIAASFQEKLASMLHNHEPLFSCKDFPVNDIDVVDLESDEDIIEEEPPLPLSVLQTVDKELERILEESIKKIDLDFQISEAETILSKKITELEGTAQEIHNSYEELERQIESIRKTMYKDQEPVRQPLDPIEILSYSPGYPPYLPRPLPPLPPPAPFLLSKCLSHPYPLQSQSNFESLSGASNEQVVRPTVAMKKVTPMNHLKVSPSCQELSSQEVVALEQVRVSQTPLPPIGTLHRPRPVKNNTVYVMKMSFFGVWAKGVVMEVINENSTSPFLQTLYKVKMEAFGNRKQFSIKTVTGRHLAYPQPAPVRLVVGTRVIAVFQDDDTNTQSKGGAYYSGLIAEPPKSNNGFRYLVFFDDGYAQYVTHDKILVVCESSRNVWDDIHPDSREFIRKYLEQYPERPMVKLAPNQVVKTEWNGKWWIARVVEVDGSLVKMSFDADKRTEWIYRGSTRLAPLFTELAHAQARQESGSISRMRGMGVVRKSNQPYVEYTQNSGVDDEPCETNSVPAPVVPSRAVAKKSTAKRNDIPLQPQICRPQSFSLEYVGITKEIQLQDVPMPKRFQVHQCNPLCIEWTRFNPEHMRGKNPLSIPLFCGWQRELGKFRKKSVIMYTAPCGRRLRSMEELHRYLRICKSKMSVDLFDFDYWVNALSEFTILDRVRKHITQDDISHQKENVPIPLVNYVDNSLPSQLIYSTDRQPYEGVPLNLDPEFLCGCDCTDDCQDKEKCACWQLTIQGSALCSGGVPDPNVGYYFKRLQERVITGIFECNSQCKCSKRTCLNRVVQHPLQLRLQLFKTETKGWGLRCLNDVPKGTFICIYAGYLYTEATANQEGNLHGDEYLAELDYIEVVERMKEDYESDVEDDVEDEVTEDAENVGKGGGKSNDDDYDDDSERRRSRHRSRDDPDKDFKIGSRSSSGAADGSIRSRLRKRTADEIESSDESKSGERACKRRDSNNKHEDDAEDDGSDDEKGGKRLPSSFTPKSVKKTDTNDEPVHRFQSVRKFFGPNERVYIMDANRVGNIGRYLNHSCSPNVFVQNVFVDTHDLRFPWVAFFALSYIKAGRELTWDYNYDVGSVPDKQIICQCGSSECRGRLL